MIFYRTALVMAALLSWTAPANAQIYLDADFNDKTVDAAIGSGGATVGEPFDIFALQAIVRAAPMSTPSLELSDIDDYYEGSVGFDFLGPGEVSNGRLSLSCDLWFPALENFTIFVREADSAACSFATVYFQDDGDVGSCDENGCIWGEGSYPTGRVTPFELQYDLDAGTYDLYLDGSLVIADRAHGATGCGIGSFFFAVTNDPDLDGTYYVDDILVESFLFKNGFERGTTDTWSSAQPLP